MLLLARAAAADFGISGLTSAGQISWTNAFTNGVCTIEAIPELDGASSWNPQQNDFTTNSAGQGVIPVSSGDQFFRLLAVDLSTNTPLAFTNLVQSYGLLSTIAGSGADAGTDGVNYWQPGFEGGYASNAALSRPHCAMSDNTGNVFIVDKDSDSVLGVTVDGRIHTVAGTHAAGNGPDTPTLATNVAMNLPNGLWVRGDGTVYVLDTGNGKVRRLDTNGIMTTLVTDPSGINGGRGLWVKNDESLIYYAAGTDLREWTSIIGIKTMNKQFNDLGNLVVDSSGFIIATDRGSNTVWRVDPNSGVRRLLFGNGGTNAVVDGTLALTNSLYGVRGVWIPPCGGYFLATDYGCQFLYVDGLGVIHVLVNGANNAHGGDGRWFYSPGLKFSQLRSISMDNAGNILIVENDVGYVRRLGFQRLWP
jgi:hypothetical protein